MFFVCFAAACQLRLRAGQQRTETREEEAEEGGPFQAAYHFREQAKVCGCGGGGDGIPSSGPSAAIARLWLARQSLSLPLFLSACPALLAARSLRVGVSAAGPACIALAPCVDSDLTGCDFPCREPFTLAIGWLTGVRNLNRISTILIV
jgi:hypothetical protein